jgi:phage gp29-like protein
MAKKDKNSKDNRAALDAPQTADIGWINQQEHPALNLTPARLNQLLDCC